MSGEYDGMNQKQIAAAEKGSPMPYEDWLSDNPDILYDAYMIGADTRGKMLRECGAFDEVSRHNAYAEAFGDLEQHLDDLYEMYKAEWDACNA